MAGRNGALHSIARFFTEVPPHIRPEDRRVFFLSNITNVYGLGAHAVALVVFWVLGVWPMALFNVLSVTLFAAAVVVNRRGQPVLSLMLGWSEIVVHQTLAVYFVGWAVGFQYYLPMIAIFSLSIPGKWPLRAFTLVFPFAVFVGLLLLLRDATPMFAMPAAHVFHIVNFVSAFGALALLPSFLRSAAAEAQRLSHAVDQLAERDRLKARFFANVSHELRTPLTLIVTPLQRLLDGEHGELPRPLREQLGSMQGNAQRLLRQVNHLLELSAIESGKATVSYEERDIAAFVEPIVGGFQAFARSKELSVSLRGADELPRVLIDPEKLDKVLCNLLSNACKFTDPGGAVAVRLSTGDDRWLQIAVKDTGCGIADEDQARVFERFEQLDDAASRQHEGSGIGLALARELTELTGGRLELQSELGLGSTFTVYLPLGREHIEDPSSIRPASELASSCAEIAAASLAAEAGRRPVAEPERSVADERDSRPLVLVAEDNPDMRRLVSEICAAEFRVQQCCDGQEAIDALASIRPDLIISDVMMPRVDGRQLLRHVRQDPQTATLPVMLLTARAGQERLEGLEQGADDYLVKPFESRELLARAKNLVRLQQQERELRQLNLELQQRVVDQTAALDRAQQLQRYLPPQVARQVLEQGQAAAQQQQRQQLTVFLLELTGFEKLLAAVEPEEMASLLNSYLSEMVELAFSHGATIDRFDRDRISGFFGAPLSEGPQPDAIRCARASAELWSRACEVTLRWQQLVEGPLPSPTLVVTSGYATVGSFGSSSRMDYTAVGGPVDLGSALMREVGAGQAVCTGATWKLIRGEVEAEACSAVEVPGHTGPVKLFRLAGPASTMLDDDRPPPAEPKHAPPAEPKRPPADEDLRGGDVKRVAEPGTLLAGRYEVIRELGAGGMGRVLLVNGRKLELEVALKLLRQDLGDDEAGLARLHREVRLARLVSHPNVARIFDLGEWSGCEFITMEYLRGRTLEHELRGGPLPLQRGLQVVRGLCAGLAAAHAAGVIHRDLKPQNIMLEPCGRVVILDFGIARPTARDRNTQLTGDGLVGTPRYMAPEQLDGNSNGVDRRADLYALGLVSFELFTGRPPFIAESTIGVAVKQLDEAPPDPLSLRPDLPPLVGAVILRCLRKRPQDRFGSAAEVGSMLASC